MPAAARSAPRLHARRLGNRIGIGWIITAAMIGALASPALASPVTVAFTGVWTLVDDAGAVLGGAITPGSAFSATLVYDDATPDSNASPLYGNYTVAPAQLGFTVTSGGFTFSHVFGGLNEIDVLHPGTGDTVSLYAEGLAVSPSVGPIGFSWAGFSLDDPSGTALSSDALTGVPWSMAAWSAGAMTIFADLDDGNPLTYFDLEGDVTSLTATPEPGTAGLVGAGLALLSLRARRR